MRCSHNKRHLNPPLPLYLRHVFLASHNYSGPILSMRSSPPYLQKYVPRRTPCWVPTRSARPSANARHRWTKNCPCPFRCRSKFQQLCRSTTKTWRITLLRGRSLARTTFPRTRSTLLTAPTLSCMARPIAPPVSSPTSRRVTRIWAAATGTRSGYRHTWTAARASPPNNTVRLAARSALDACQSATHVRCPRSSTHPHSAGQLHRRAPSRLLRSAKFSGALSQGSPATSPGTKSQLPRVPSRATLERFALRAPPMTTSPSRPATFPTTRPSGVTRAMFPLSARPA